jgi:hypothetical protein
LKTLRSLKSMGSGDPYSTHIVGRSSNDGIYIIGMEITFMA